LGVLHLKQERLEEALHEFEAAAGLGLDTAAEIRSVREQLKERN
jgi:hypothetical protein